MMEWYGWWKNPEAAAGQPAGQARFYPQLPTQDDALAAQRCFAVALALDGSPLEAADQDYFGELLGNAWPGFGALLLVRLGKAGLAFNAAVPTELAGLIAYARSLRCLAERDPSGREACEALLLNDPARARLLRRAMSWDFADLSFLDGAALKRIIADAPPVEIAAALRDAERHSRAALAACLEDTPPTAPLGALAGRYCRHRLLCRVIAAVEQGVTAAPDLPGFRELAGPPPALLPTSPRKPGSALEQRGEVIAARLFERGNKVFDLALVPAVAENLLALAALDGDAARWVFLALAPTLRVQVLLHLLEHGNAEAVAGVEELFMFLPQREARAMLDAVQRHLAPEAPTPTEIVAARERLVERLAACDAAAIRAWLAAMDARNLLTFLAECPAPLGEAILAQMSPRAATMAREDLESLGPQSRQRVNVAYCAALRAMRGVVCVEQRHAAWETMLCRAEEGRQVELENRWLTFEALCDFGDREIQCWLRECQSEDLVIFMKACSATLRERILANMSQRAAAMLRNDLTAKAAVDARTARQALRQVVAAARTALAAEQY